MDVRWTLDESRMNVKRKSDEHWTDVEGRSNRRRTKQQNGKMAEQNGVMERTATTTDCDYNGLWWQRHCRAIRICELYGDGMQKRREEFFLLLRVFLNLLFSFSFSSSSRAATRAIHYMTTSLKTHRSVRPRC
jgi:hypothetical protein